MAIWRNAGSFRGTASARAWVLTIARNQVHRRFRRSSERPDGLSLTELGANAGWGAEEHVAFEEFDSRDIVSVMLSRLSHEDREVVLLRDIEILDNHQVAELLGISVAAVKSRVHRARLRLMAAIRDELLESERE